MSINNLSILAGHAKQTKTEPALREERQIQSAATYHVGVVTRIEQQNACCVIDQEVHGIIADGMLTRLSEGDTVAYLQSERGIFVLQLLKRADNESYQIHLQQPLHIHAPSINLSAEKELQMVSLNRFAMIARHGVLSASETLVSTAEHAIHHVAQFLVSARGLLRLNARDQLITAEEDVRVDGKRINMG